MARPEDQKNEIPNRGALAGTATSKQPNHLDIHDSINNVHSVVYQLYELRDSLNNENEKTGGDVPEQVTPSFIDVLNHTPGNIRAECDQANEIIAEIRSMLLN